MTKKEDKELSIDNGLTICTDMGIYCDFGLAILSHVENINPIKE